MPKFYAIGVGPGDKELLTLKAVKILNSIDVVFSPVSNNKNTALNIAREYINSKCEVICLDFPMIRDREILEKKWKNAAQIILEKLNKNKSVAYITLGDIAFYSTFSYIKDIIEYNGFDVEIIPGIPSFSAGAASSKITICEGKEKIIILPCTDKDDKLEYYIDNFDSIILMKVFKMFDYVKNIIISKSIVENCILFSNIGMKNEKIYRGKEILYVEDIGYFTTLIIKKRKD